MANLRQTKKYTEKKLRFTAVSTFTVDTIVLHVDFFLISLSVLISLCVLLDPYFGY